MVTPDETRRPIRPSRRTLLTGSAALGATALTAPFAAPAFAAPTGSPIDNSEGWPEGPGQPNQPQAPDAELKGILAAIDPNRIEENVRMLASFGTRHTLSSQDDTKRGIGAAHARHCETERQ